MVTHDEHDDRPGEEIDPRVHADLDGEVVAADVPATAADAVSAGRQGRQLATLRTMESWLQSTRQPSPDDLAERVIEAIGSRGASRSMHAATAPGAADPGGAWRRLWDRFIDGWRGAAWATPATALAIVLLLVLARSGLPPGEPQRDRARTGAMVTAGQRSDDAIAFSFRVDAPDAEEVCLVGTFNHWSVCNLPMRRNTDGTWTATVPLEPGRHEYMFVIDGDWTSDPRAEQLIDDGFGNLNAVLYL